MASIATIIPEFEDKRLNQVLEIITEFISISSINDNQVECMITDDNNLIINLSKTFLYIIPLININDNINYPLSFNLKYLKDILLDKENMTYINNNVLYNNINNIYIHHDIKNIYNYYINIFNNYPLLVSDNNILSDKDFIDLMDIKSTDDMAFYRAKNRYLPERYHLIPVFNSVPSIKKNDNVSLYVYNMMDNCLLVRYDIFKKKLNRTYKFIFRALKIN